MKSEVRTQKRLRTSWFPKTLPAHRLAGAHKPAWTSELIIQCLADFLRGPAVEAGLFQFFLCCARDILETAELSKQWYSAVFLRHR